jgi:hypothetical protein
MAGTCPYVHSLLFRCEDCMGPLTISVPSEESNLERVDGDIFEVECTCGWWKNLLGVEAVRHWVVTWEL